MSMISVLRILILASSLIGSAYAKEDASTITIVGATLVDLQGNSPVPDAIVVVSGEEIAAVGNAADIPVPDAARVIDLNGLWLIPGMLNMHVHLGLKLPGKMAAELARE